MARKINSLYQAESLGQMDIGGFMDQLIGDLEKDGTLGKWKVEKKLKEVKRVERESTRRIREEQIIAECLKENQAKKRRKRSVGA